MPSLEILNEADIQSLISQGRRPILNSGLVGDQMQVYFHCIVPPVDSSMQYKLSMVGVDIAEFEAPDGTINRTTAMWLDESGYNRIRKVLDRFPQT
ncbi:hypothetical protein A3J19_00445 [Candidatus Daviesbacteria bacterium RIFCSPLOWO2_02_FULL_41_8]|uniref:Uncharacterized protein n=3 Tax=Candidatus Daviesiibacteriota TaxID=1752718 RepID=A0A1F5NHH3_9BACT|nr:MAG: hypothetical protein A2871_02790 [Candidatus Daviesbacteria bacterium RIFCSPHIGHO2_01_FULL_41_23]OGE33837.1 MAG: hypothetical protein A3D83_04665 [Candidatus Daviesbacteria bacterium RIFCSPHIGHO2_02_FULL_41_10]OGE62104.1 MAG: hypothetical protein A2967_00405 [Candidatus Daviesbacteria bacterium RIFCSPLOWO2_01_FULL_41_32]OGE76870.1 MAG: hypothetical protein A3J19_00445 [Candidatus Daviesbacteria bacterium RIFCSPLOWO2_02_FULL_41_8]